METQKYMAIDQYGNTEHGLDHPRKDLMERYFTKHAEKMYIWERYFTDSIKTGNARHSGYVVAGHWFDVFKVTPINS